MGTRRDFLGGIAGGVLARIAPLALGSMIFVPRRAAADNACFDPIADQTGWSTDGDESFTSGSSTTPLVVIDDVGTHPDPAYKPYLTLYCADPAFFGSDASVSPVLSIDPGTGQGKTGVHVTLNDGLHQIRVVVRQEMVMDASLFPDGVRPSEKKRLSKREGEASRSNGIDVPKWSSHNHLRTEASHGQGYDNCCGHRKADVQRVLGGCADGRDRRQDDDSGEVRGIHAHA